MPTFTPAAPAAIKGILFDLDGTLVDSAPDIGNAANSTLVSLGMPPVEKDRVAGWIGNGIPKLVKRALTGDFDGEPDPALFAKALPIFMAHYERDVCVDSYLYAGVAHTLNQLHDAGFILGVITNKAASCTLPLLNQIGIDEYFTTIVSGDTCQNKKPDPEPVLFGLEEMGLAASDCILVGDSAHDLHAASNAGLPAIAVSYGYNQGVDLSTLSPAAMVDHFGDIAPLVQLAS